MLEAGAILERIDRIMAELAELRAAVAADTSTIVEVSDGNLLDTTSAQERFGYPRDTISRWCREEGLGVRRGGRWLVDIAKLRQRLNGKAGLPV